VIYSPNSEGLLNATIPLFEEKYGVNVELIQAGTGELVKRIQSEKNDPYADVLFGGSWSLMYTNEDLWEPYVSANDANVIDAYKNKCGFITGNVLDGSVLIVNRYASGVPMAMESTVAVMDTLKLLIRVSK
jgi:iron(III) transport system substrate-binding protein